MKVIDTDSFIEKAKSIHGDTYSYELVNYVNSKTKVNILCTIHGVFEQVPYSHTRGNGCVYCSRKISNKKQSLKLSDFITKSKLIHDNKYDYSLVNYINSYTSVIIKCKKHGEFSQLPKTHLKGSECKKCSNEIKSLSQVLTKDFFINESIKKHGNRYDYGLVEYKGYKTKVKIKCDKHGLFCQLPSVHLKGSGCPKCGYKIISKHHKNNPIGWSLNKWKVASENNKNFDSFKVYIIKCWNDTEQFYKIGRTFTTTEIRFRNKKSMPYNYEIINEFISDKAEEAFKLEKELQNKNKEYKYTPDIKFKGMYECFYFIKL